MVSKSILVFFFLATFGLIYAQDSFTNPIIDIRSADPAVLRHGDHYYLTIPEEGETIIAIYKSAKLTDFRNASRSVIFRAKDTYNGVWASELHEIDGGLYLYFSMSGGGKGHFSYALKADDPSDPMGNWSEEIRLLPDWVDENGSELGGIDGTVFRHGNGKMYYVYTSGALGRQPGQWITEMIDPLTMSADVVYLRGPDEPWEMKQIEGGYFFYKNNVSYLAFSVGSTWDPNYAIGVMSIPADKDPMVPENWDVGTNEPVFWRNDEEEVFGPGHASFTYSPDGSELWMIYHALSRETGDDVRIARAEKIDFDAEGKPIFPRPHGPNSPQPVPSGQAPEIPNFSS